MKRLSYWLCFLMVFALVLPLGAGAVTIANQEEADAALENLDGTTVMDFRAYWDGVSKTANDQITFEKVTDAQGPYSSYLRTNVISAESGSTSRQLLYRSLSGISAGDSVLFSFVMRSAGGSEGKAAVTLMAQGATSSANKSFTIPTQWTRIYIPLTAKDAATITTFRLNSLAQTVDIADYEVINYGSEVALSALPSGSYAVTQEEEPTVEGLVGGTQVTMTDDLYAQAVKAQNETVTFTAPQAVPSGNMALLALDVKAESACANMRVSFAGTTKEYAVPVQWSRIYMPVKAGTDIAGATVTVQDAPVYIASATLENKGSASFEELSLQSGMWLLEDFEDVALDPVASGVGAGKTTDLVISPDGKYVYSIGGGKFTVTDVAQQKVVCQLTGFGDTRQIALCNDGDAVIFTSRIYGAYIVDVSDPVNAKLVSHYDTLEMGTGIATYGDYAFICSRFYGVEVVDISDLSDPTHKCIIRNGGEVQSVEVVDGYLYGGLYNTNQVEIYDVRDPVNYVRVGVADLSGRGDGVTVAKVGDKTYLYAGTGHHSVAGLSITTPLSNLNYGDGNGLDIFDVTDPSNPVWLSTSRTDGRFYHTSCDYWGAQVSHDEETGKYYAYLVSTYNGIYVFDVTDPAAPIRVAHVAVRMGTDSEYYKKPTSTRDIIFQYDPEVYVQSPAGAVACADGALLYAGVETDLHVLTADYAHAHVEKAETAQIQSGFDYHNYDAFKDLTGFAYATSQGQTASVALYGDKVYVSAGDQGIAIYSEDLQTLHKVIDLEGCCYDVYIQDGKLYSSEGTKGFAIYTIGDDGLTLTEQIRYTSGCVTMARPSATGKFVTIHCSATVGEIVDVSGTSPVRKVRASANSQMYHHNVLSGVVSGRYVCLWANSSSERWYDLGENDSLSAPVLLSNVPSAGFTPKVSMPGGYIAYGESMVLVTGNGGYYVYDPTQITADSLKALGVTRPVNSDGTSIKVSGKPAIYGNTLVLSDRIYGKLYIVDITDIKNPVLLSAYENLPGNPDVAAFNEDSIYIPLGYNGIIKLDLAENGADASRHYGGDHCTCGGHAKGMSGHSCANVTWKPWTDPTSLPDSGNYYLTTDVTVATQTTIAGKLRLCLNGHSITASGTDRVYSASSREIHVTDCREENTWGTMYGGNVVQTYSGNGGAIFYGVNPSFRLYLYGGNFVGGTAARAGIAYAAGGQIHLYGGNLTDGTATKMGGNLYINAAASLYMYGGTVKNGTATGAAGNIFVNVKAAMYLYGGTITGGTAGTTGGNISVNGGGSSAGQYGGSLTVTGGTVMNGTAGTMGGNVYVGGANDLNTAGSMTLSGGTVTGGTANNPNATTEEGGNIYSLGTLTMENGTVSHGNACDGYGGNISIGSKVISGEQTSVFTLTGGSISGGNARMGGSMEVKGNFMMTGGTVTGGSATADGGNIRVFRPGVFTLSGGSVSDGKAATGKDLCLYGHSTASNGTRLATANLNSGSIGDVAMLNYCAVDISGAAVDAVELRSPTETTLSLTDYTGEEMDITVADPQVGDLIANADADYSEKLNLNTGYRAVYKDGQLLLAYRAVHALDEDGNLLAGFDTLDEALTQSAAAYRLHSSLDAQTISQSILLDLNGNSLTNARVSADMRLMDSATDDYTGVCGSLAGSITGKVQTFAEFGGNTYVAVCQDGVYSSHRYDVKLTHVNLKPSHDALGYKAKLYGDETVMQYVTDFGFHMWVSEENVKTFSKTGTQELTLRLNGILASNAGETPIFAKAFVVLNVNGEESTKTTTSHSTTMRRILETVNTGFADYTQAQKTAVYTLVKKYEGALSTWTLGNILAWIPSEAA